MNAPQVIYRELPATVKGMAAIPAWSPCPIIIINAILPEEEQAEALQHELEHLARGDHYSADNIRSIEEADNHDRERTK